jgi:predicted transcriptional regulator
MAQTNGALKSEYLKIRVDSELKNALLALATRRGEKLADVCRRALRDAAEKGVLSDGEDAIARIVRNCMRDVLKPTEERLAKINAKTAILSGTAMYMNMQVIEDAGYDSHDIYTKARKKAVALLQEREGETL